MATFQITMNDKVYAAALQTFEGATDADKLVNLKQYVRAELRGKIKFAKELEAREQANKIMRNAIAAIDADLEDV